MGCEGNRNYFVVMILSIVQDIWAIVRGVWFLTQMISFVKLSEKIVAKRLCFNDRVLGAGKIRRPQDLL